MLSIAYCGCWLALAVVSIGCCLLSIDWLLATAYFLLLGYCLLHIVYWLSIGYRHQIEGPKRAPKESAQGRLPQSDLPQKTSKYELSY
jgi:hypothetical protein